MKNEIMMISQSSVAQALAADYFCIYYVNVEDDRFIEYSASPEYRELGLPDIGDDFISFARYHFEKNIFPEDQEMFLEGFTKEKIIKALDAHGNFTMTFRMMFRNIPTYVHVKITRMIEEENRHVVIGISSVDDQMKAREEYRQKVAEARTSARNDFLANMSHDIRTPMNAIVGFTNIAKNNREDPETVAFALDKIASSSHYLLSLINDILDISKIESGKMQLSMNACDLGELFRRIEDITMLQAKDKSLIISYQHESIRHYHVIADELRIEQILVNIISNAIKYTPRGGRVDLVAEEETLPDGKTNKYRFIVRDTGIGISQDYLPYIFESFTREEKTTVNQVQGTGLGLAITARIVELMEGTIDVKSAPGKGSTFTVELELEESEEETVSRKEEEIPDTDLTGCHALLVEDNHINAEIAVMILSSFGMSCDRAENGQEGFESIQKRGTGCYDVVLMDIQMPVMNGYEAARKIRELEGDYYRNLPIIAMSANAYDEDVRDCLDVGMNAHVAKPFNPEDLRKELQKWIQKD